MGTKLSEAHEYILNLIVDKGSRHRDWIAEIAKQKGFRVVNRSLNTLIERALISVDEDDYATITPAGLAAIGAPQVVEAAPEKHEGLRVGQQEWRSTAQHTFTPEEIAAYDPAEPIPPHRQGATADDTVRSYEYEIAALKAQNEALRAALEPFAKAANDAQTLSTADNEPLRVQVGLDHIDVRISVTNVWTHDGESDFLEMRHLRAAAEALNAAPVKGDG